MNNLTLRQLQENDADSLFRLVDANRPHLSKFTWELKTKSSIDSENYIYTVNDKERSNGAPTRGVWVDDQLIGIVTLHTIEWATRSSVIGYWIDAAHTGCGYSTKAARELVAIAFESLQLERLTASVDVTNSPSIAVLERVGFVCDRIGNDATWISDTDNTTNVAHYSMILDDYYRNI